MATSRREAAQEIREAISFNNIRRILQAKRKKKGLPRYVSTGEYKTVYLPKHPRAYINGHVFEHILVAEYHIRHLVHLGKNHPQGEVVHHKDMNRSNNHPSNLQIMKRGAHSRFHNQFRIKPVSA